MTNILLLLIGVFLGGSVGYLIARLRSASQISAARAELATEQARNNSHITGEERLENSLRTLSREAVEHNNSRFSQLVTPVQESIAKITQHVESVEKERTDAYARLREQVDTMHRTNVQLRTETAQLVAALRAPAVRGRWGESQLKRIVEASGMVEHVDFVEQPTLKGEEGMQRPDMVVSLSGGKHIVIDAKVPLLSYLEAMEARDDSSRDDLLVTHAKHLRAHVETLGDKSYWEAQEGSPEFVVLFVPADTFLDAAVRADAGLMEHAFARNVVIATPSTLVALLRTVAYTWRQESIAKNAEEIQKLGRDLHQRLVKFTDHFSKIGTTLGTAVNRYNQAVGSLEGRVLVSARKFSELQGESTAITESEQIEKTPRQLQAPEAVEPETAKKPTTRKKRTKTEEA